MADGTVPWSGGASFSIDDLTGSGFEGLGDYRSLNGILPPHPGPRAADVFAANTGAPMLPPHTGSWPESQPTYLGAEG